MRTNSTNKTPLRATQSNLSFTLVELLIVIGILAILTAAVVVILNPAELLRQARDSQRLQELSSLSDSIQLLETQVANLTLGTSTWVYVSIPDSDAQCANLGLPTLPSGYTYACSTEANYRNIDGLGWIPIDFTQGSGIISLPTLPIDPTNATSTGLYYTYMSGGSFHLAGATESDKYGLGGSSDAVSTDGGSFTGLIEKGTDKALIPLDYGDTSLVGYWTFDEGTGTSAYDHSGNNNTGTLTNGPTWQTSANCKVGGCLEFDGEDDVVPLGTGNYLDFLTISAWVYLDSYPPLDSVYAIVHRTEDYPWKHNYYFEINSTLEFKFGIYSTTANTWKSINTTQAVSLAQWHHATASYDLNGDLSGVFLNGEKLDPIGTIPPGSIPNSVGIFHLSIGGNYAESARYFDGLIDDVRIYNRALSAAEIQAIYNATR